MSFKCYSHGGSLPAGSKPVLIPQVTVTIEKITQEYIRGLVVAWSEVSYKIVGHKQVCQACAESMFPKFFVLEVVDRTQPVLNPDTQEEEIPPGFLFIVLRHCFF